MEIEKKEEIIEDDSMKIVSQGAEAVSINT